MLAALIAVSAVLLLCVAAAGVLIHRTSTPTAASAGEPEVAPEWFQRVLKKQIVVHTQDDQSIQGVLMEHTLDGVILRAAGLLGDGGQKTAIAGEAFIPREKIAFAQIDE